MMGDRMKEVKIGGMVLRVWLSSWGSREWGSSGYPGSEEQGCLEAGRYPAAVLLGQFWGQASISYISSLNEQRSQLSGRGGDSTQCM